MLLLVFFFAWLPLYWNNFYLAADAGLGKKLFAIISGTLFAVGIITLIPLGVCIHILSALLMMLSTMSTEAAANSIYNPNPNPHPNPNPNPNTNTNTNNQAAADSIHPSVAQLGLRRTLTRTRTLNLSVPNPDPNPDPVTLTLTLTVTL